MQKFGYTINSKGYKVLPPYLRVIQGDGIEEKSIRDILQELAFRKISASNIAFGMGAKLLQSLDRDTLRFACKCSEITINGIINDVYKNPVTDPDKKSKKGRLALIKVDNRIVTIREDQLQIENILVDVFRNGSLLVDYNFDQIKSRVS